MQQDVLNDNTPEEINFEKYATQSLGEEATEAIYDAFGAYTEKIVALALHLEIDFEEAQRIEVSSYDDCVFEYGSKEYLVCTDSEADEKWEEYLDNYIDECVLPEISEPYRNYFNDKSFKDDCRKDGREHSLARYDGYEAKQKVLGVYYYIYRQN